jgi:hypothetical protein
LNRNIVTTVAAQGLPSILQAEHLLPAFRFQKCEKPLRHRRCYDVPVSTAPSAQHNTNRGRSGALLAAILVSKK